MKQVEKVAEAKNFCVVRFGQLRKLGEYELNFGEMKIPGKVFGDAVLGTNGSNFSFQLFQPGTETGFLHTHKSHEELYFFLGGKGEFQVDGEVFPIEEGSVVRVSPAGRRSVRNNGTEPLIMLCVQYRSTSFTAEDAADGVISAEPVKW